MCSRASLCRYTQDVIAPQYRDVIAVVLSHLHPNLCDVIAVVLSHLHPTCVNFMACSVYMIQAQKLLACMHTASFLCGLTEALLVLSEMYLVLWLP